jgi:hypothetical protein
MAPTLATPPHETGGVELADLPIHDPRESISSERINLLVLLEDLSDSDWLAPTEAGHWRVKDVGLDLLDDDLGWLSRGRDGDMTGLLPTAGDYREFVRSLDVKNEQWVVGVGGLSRRVVVDLLRWSGLRGRRLLRLDRPRSAQPRDLGVGQLCAPLVRPVPRSDRAVGPPAAHPRCRRAPRFARSASARCAPYVRVGLPPQVRGPSP